MLHIHRLIMQVCCLTISVCHTHLWHKTSQQQHVFNILVYTYQYIYAQLYLFVAIKTHKNAHNFTNYLPGLWQSIIIKVSYITRASVALIRHMYGQKLKLVLIMALPRQELRRGSNKLNNTFLTFAPNRCFMLLINLKYKWSNCLQIRIPINDNSYSPTAHCAKNKTGKSKP